MIWIICFVTSQNVRVAKLPQYIRGPICIVCLAWMGAPKSETAVFCAQIKAARFLCQTSYTTILVTRYNPTCSREVNA